MSSRISIHTQNTATRAAHRIALIVLAVLAAVLLLTLADGQWDIRISRFYFDARAHVFPWHVEPWVQQVLYYDGKLAAITLDLLLIGAVLTAAAVGSLPRRIALAATVGMLAIPTVIALLKLISSTPCPWDLSIFGGTAAHHGLLTMPVGGSPGHCMPAGHPSAGLAIIGLILPLAAAGRRQLALLATIAGLALGLAMGWLRIAQGAHFLSHVLWSLWISVAVALVTARSFGLSWAAADHSHEHSRSNSGHQSDFESNPRFVQRAR
ncbi:MAG: phosphatase PAP2 family protein [Burkholderiaceae bacterium]